MQQKYEYKFVKIGEGWLGAKGRAKQYESIVHEHARQGWRFVQVLLPNPTGFINKQHCYAI